MRADLDQTKMSGAAAEAAVRTKSKDDVKVEKAKLVDSGVLHDLIGQLGQDGQISGSDLKLLRLFLGLLEQLGDNVSSSQSPTIGGSWLDDEAPEPARAASPSSSQESAGPDRGSARSRQLQVQPSHAAGTWQLRPLGTPSRSDLAVPEAPKGKQVRGASSA